MVIQNYGRRNIKKHDKLKFILPCKIWIKIQGVLDVNLFCTICSVLMLLLGASGAAAAVVQAWRIKAAAATCRVRLVFMTFHSTEPERSMRNMPDINSRL